KAKEMGMDAWIDATLIGKPLYEKYGFKVVQRSALILPVDHLNESVKSWKRKW
ncbi:hypothetical protein CC78DRAFT_462095, partial [Lojkania enalia]